jgi:cytochrome P450
MIRFMRDPLRLYDDCHAAYGDLFMLDLGSSRMVMACAPELVKAIYRADPEVLAAGAAKDSVFGPVVGHSSVLVLDGTAHIERRRVLIPAFRGERMLAYTELMRRATEELLPTWPIDQPFSLHPHVERIAMMAALRGIFGEDMDPRVPQVLSRVISDAVGSKLLFMPKLQIDLGAWSPWGKVLAALANADVVLYSEITRRRREGTAGREDTLSLLMDAKDEDGSTLTDLQLRDELVTLVAAGYEISGLALAWVFSDILSRPKVQAQIEAEIRAVAGGEPISRNHATELHTLDAAIKESLRLHPPVSQGSVRLVRAPFDLGGYTIPPGVKISVNMHILHRRADCHPDPLEFKLERFLHENPEPNTWVPFGGGTRRCLGMQLALHEFKVVIATILQQLRLEIAQPQVLAKRRGAFMVPSGGPRVLARHFNPEMRHDRT